MKKLLYLSLFLFLTNFCYGQEKKKLPEHPWLEIVEMDSHEYTPITKWVTDINIGLEGYYSKADSIYILKSVKKLDSLTETLSITFLRNKPVNLKIKFMNELVRDNTFNNIVNASYKIDKKLGDGYSGAEVYIQRIDKTEDYIRKTLEYRIATTIAGCKFLMPFKKDQKRKSIFNPYQGLDNSDAPLSNKDMAVIKAIYSKDFESNLKIAKKQFGKKITDYKYSKRRKTIWWVQNPIAIIFIPVLLLFLVFLFFTSKIKNYIDKKLNNNLFKFLLVGFIVVCFIDIIVIFSVSFYDYLRTPPSFGFSIIRFDTVFSTLVVSLFCFPFLFLFRFLEKKIEKTGINTIKKTSLIFLSTGIIPFIIILFLVYFFGDTGEENLNQVYLTLSIMFLVLMTITSIRTLISYFIFKEKKLILDNEKQLSNLKELKAKAELKSLQAQINPHFLYNSLNSIASLAKIDAEKTQKMAFSLSDLFKYSINRKDKKTNTIKDEVEMVKTYLEIEKIRFEDRLQFTFDVDISIENKEIPLFLIQPLVENAIKHGVSKNIGQGKINLKIEKEENSIFIAVYDNGPDFPEGLISGHGLQTVYDLLRLNYKDNASLNWTNTPEKMIFIQIPNGN